MRLRLTNAADWKRLVSYVKDLPFMRDGKGVAYLVSIEEMKSRRSLEQNSRYWALMTAISKQAPDYMGGEWHSPDSWHKYCSTRFLGMEAGPYGTGVPKSTRDLGVGKFSEYMMEIEIWAGEQFAGFEFEWQEAA